MEIAYENDGRGLSEYILVARPDRKVCDKVWQEKQVFFDTYKQGLALQNPPDIKIAHFHANESMEETVIRWIQRICSQHRSFLVTLNNYSGFPPHTIYLRIQDHAPFNQLADQLVVIDEYVRSNGYPHARIVYRPHVTIADGLGSTLYDRAMSDYSQKTFHETFMMEELVLLRRNNQFDTCKQVNVFRFYPPDTNTYNRVA